MPILHSTNPSLTAFSSLLWDVYINDTLAVYSHQEFSERNIIVDPDTFQKISETLNWSRVERESIGSSPTNAAIAFAALGGTVQVIGPGNHGSIAEKTRAYLTQYAINQIYSQPAAISPGQCICFHNDDHERQFLVLYPIFDVATIQLPPINWHETDWLLTSTYEFTTPQLADLLIREIKNARKAAVKIAFDAGDSLFIRRHFKFIKLLFESQIDVLQVDDGSLTTLRDLLRMTSSSDCVEYLREITGILIHTEGNRGLTVYYDDQVFSPKIHFVKPKDTTGAGDTVLGSFLWALSSGYPAEAAIQLGTMTAEAVVNIVGPHPDKEMMQGILKEWNARIT